MKYDDMDDEILAGHYTAILAAKRGPTENEMEDAPKLNLWSAGIEWDYAVYLHGYTVGHPKLGDRHIATSQLIAIDPAGIWARTYSRFYKLGKPANVPADQVFGMYLVNGYREMSQKTVGELLQDHAEKIVRLARERGLA